MVFEQIALLDAAHEGLFEYQTKESLHLLTTAPRNNNL